VQPGTRRGQATAHPEVGRCDSSTAKRSGTQLRTATGAPGRAPRGSPLRTSGRAWGRPRSLRPELPHGRGGCGPGSGATAGARAGRPERGSSRPSPAGARRSALAAWVGLAASCSAALSACRRCPRHRPPRRRRTVASPTATPPEGRRVPRVPRTGRCLVPGGDGAVLPPRRRLPRHLRDGRRRVHGEALGVKVSIEGYVWEPAGEGLVQDCPSGRYGYGERARGYGCALRLASRRGADARPRDRRALGVEAAADAASPGGCGAASPSRSRSVSKRPTATACGGRRPCSSRACGRADYAVEKRWRWWIKNTNWGYTVLYWRHLASLRRGPRRVTRLAPMSIHLATGRVPDAECRGHGGRERRMDAEAPEEAPPSRRCARPRSRRLPPRHRPPRSARSPPAVRPEGTARQPGGRDRIRPRRTGRCAPVLALSGTGPRRAGPRSTTIPRPSSPSRPPRRGSRPVAAPPHPRPGSGSAHGVGLTRLHRPPRGRHAPCRHPSGHAGNGRAGAVGGRLPPWSSFPCAPRRLPRARRGAAAPPARRSIRGSTGFTRAQSGEPGRLLPWVDELVAAGRAHAAPRPARYCRRRRFELGRRGARPPRPGAARRPS
jgi:hypothetical protein